MVQVELADGVSTKTQKAGDSVALRLAQPVIVNGQIVMRAGARGLGQVVESAKPGMGGKPAKLVLAARYLTVRHTRIALQGLQLHARFEPHLIDQDPTGGLEGLQRLLASTAAVETQHPLTPQALAVGHRRE